ncbi:HNH endonuclease signature motif containing protein [Nocardioides sp. 503]|uniref:HNH endonuclease n=1 Tax=Nocardioides sp. 503 TaxID=2508326 RepID=UPI00107058D7|nr:HNH endonuclease signature motif containing protein [Nocardioides sp. 503]
MFESLMDQVRGARSALAACPSDLTDAERVDLLRELEDLKCAASAAQAVTAVELEASQRAAQVEAGVRASRVGEGVAAQIGLARRESPHAGARLLGLGKVLIAEMPHTLRLMQEGRLSEWRAMILARETACLSVEDRAEVDARLCANGEAASMSDQGLSRAARKLACELDPAAVAARARRAEAERHVSLRPAPDTMCWIRVLLPVKQAVWVYAVLLTIAKNARSQGDPRSQGQLMADALVERVTSESAEAAPKVELKLVMSDTAFFGTSEDAADLEGYGPVPAPWARAFVRDAAAQARLWVRRLYVAPSTGELIGMDSRARCAPGGLAAFVATRDLGLCRTPWCGAPIREADHVVAYEDGGVTAAFNLQGLCRRCNLVKQALGWRAAQVFSLWRHTVETTTPTGHTYRSRAPAPPGHVDIYSPGERLLLELIA